MNELPNTIDSEQIPVLIALLPDEDPAFARAIEVMRVAPGDCVTSPDMTEQYLYILVSGRIQLVVLNNEGRSLVTAYLDPGSIFGEDALIDLDETSRGLCTGSESLHDLAADAGTGSILQ